MRRFLAIVALIAAVATAGVAQAKDGQCDRSKGVCARPTPSAVPAKVKLTPPPTDTE